MNKNRFFLLLVLLNTLGCRKETKNQSSSTNNSGSTTTITSSNATKWYGLFSVDIFHDISQSSTQIYSTAQVSFFRLPEQFPGTESTMVDSVVLNGIPMQFWPFQDSSYVDTAGVSNGIPRTISYPYIFKVSSKNIIIPSFTYTENGPFPDYTGHTFFPDTINRANGLTVSLSGISGTDYLLVDIITGSKEVSHTIYPPFPLVNNFTSAELLQLDTTSYGTIQVILIKNDNKNVNNKPMLFSSGCNYNKHIIVK